LKKKVSALCGGIITVVLLVCMLGYCSNLVERKASTKKFEDFYNQEEDFDVLFFGTSHMVNAVLPMELWNEYGMVSYNYGIHGSSLAVTYWSIVNALDYTTPKLIVVDTYGLSTDRKLGMSYDNEENVMENRRDQMHLVFDSIPLSVNKITACVDLFREYDCIAEFLWDFIIYHNRWSELTEEDFRPASLYEKGAELLLGKEDANVEKDIGTEVYLEQDTIAIEYLYKIIELCEEKEIELMFTYLPFPAAENEQKEANTTALIAQDKEIEFINFLEMEGVVDFRTDNADPHSHLNYLGALKVTEYLGDYLVNHYDIPDRKEESDYKQWHTDYEEYLDDKIERLKQQKTVLTYLLALSDPNLYYEVALREDSSVLYDGVLVGILEEHREKNNWSMLPIGNTEADISIKVIDKRTNEVIEIREF